VNRFGLSGGSDYKYQISEENSRRQLILMPGLARLDAPGILHRVIGRGIKRKRVFFNDMDRREFIDRLAVLAEGGAMDGYTGADVAHI
jgi:hypothetical protein